MLIAGIIVAVVAIILYSTYVSVVSKNNNALEAKSGIDVQLQKRHSLIPNILEIAKKFMEHEKSLLTEITELRTKVLENSNTNPKQKFDIENQLEAKLGQLMVQVENYPQLKSDQTMIQAMRTYNEVEEHIAAARRFYNSAVKELRNAVQIFPGTLFAGMVQLEQFPFFEAAEIAKQEVSAKDYLN